MFSIRPFHHDGFDIIALEDQTSGTSVEVIPGHGAMLHAFRLPQGLNIIDGYTGLDDYLASKAEYFKGAKLSPFACRIPEGIYSWQGEEYRLETSVVHGLLYDASFIVLSVHAGAKSAKLELFYRYDGTDTGYPFPYECTVRYELLPDTTLNISTNIYNAGDKAMPLMDGWHPYFTTGGKVDELELQFTASRIVEFNAQLVPTGRLLPWDQFKEFSSLAGVELDNSFMPDQPGCELRDPGKRVFIKLMPDENYRILQIYIPPHRNSIAIEHLTGPPNAFNNCIGLITLGAGEQRTFTTTITAGSC